MYDRLIMKTISFRPDRLRFMMEKRKLTPGQLHYLTNISQPTISLLMNGERPNVSAVFVAKLADALNCSMEYLVGLSDDYTPNSITLTDALAELLVIARGLPSFRQDDLLSQAKMYLEKNEKEDTHLMNVLLDKINDLGGEEAEELLLKLLQSLRPGPGGDTALDAPTTST